jgi:hypothetical protein
MSVIPRFGGVSKDQLVEIMKDIMNPFTITELSMILIGEYESWVSSRWIGNASLSEKATYLSQTLSSNDPIGAMRKILNPAIIQKAVSLEAPHLGDYITVSSGVQGILIGVENHTTLIILGKKPTQSSIARRYEKALDMTARRWIGVRDIDEMGLCDRWNLIMAEVDRNNLDRSEDDSDESDDY